MFREYILSAALDELKVGNAATFSLHKVATRAGVAARTVQQVWPNTPELFAATVTSFTSQHLADFPDTGTLYGDLLRYAMSCADIVNTPTGRRLVDSLIVRPNDWNLAGSREAFFASWHSGAVEIIERGIERGECAPATDPRRTIDTLTLTVCMPVLIYDRPVTADDCEYAVQMVFRGIS